MTENLYETDILLWSEQQAALLRRIAASEHAPNEIDWPNVAKEIESVGEMQLVAVEDCLVRAMRLMLEAEAWPRHSRAPEWRADARSNCFDAQRQASPSMLPRIELATLYRDARDTMCREMDGEPLPADPPVQCPWTLEQLLDRTFWPEALSGA